MNRIVLLLLSALGLGASEPLYHQDFTALTALPDEIMALNGEFSVSDDGGNHVLSLEPAPLDTDTCLFGPTGRDGVAVRGRCKSANKGRLSPSFGFGIGGVTGFVLRLAGTKKALELVRDDQVLASAPLEWKSDTWLWFHLQLRKVDAAWIVEGKAWADGAAEPQAWQVSQTLDKQPTAGRASCWGMPYSGKPILFDDLTVVKVAP